MAQKHCQFPWFWMEYHPRNWDKSNFESLTIASVLTQTKGNRVWTSQTINGQQVYTCLTVTISDLCCCLGGGQRRRRCIQPGSTPECSLSELQVFQKWAESASFHFILNASRADISGVKSQHHTVLFLKPTFWWSSIVALCCFHCINCWLLQ